MSLSSFRDYDRQRSGHLCWRAGDVSLDSLLEDASSYPHLDRFRDNKYDSYWDDHSDHAMTDDEVGAYESHHASLSPEERALTHEYKRDSEHFNHWLRNGTGRIPGHILVSGVMPTSESSALGQAQRKREFESLDRATSFKTPRDAVVYRGMEPNSEIHSVPTGEKFVDHGYMGTSALKNVALSHAGTHENYDKWSHYPDLRVPRNLEGHKIVAKIHVPAGTMGHYFNVDPTAPYPRERELVLHRGTHFQVLGHSRVYHSTPANGPTRGVHLVHMRVVGQKPLPLITHSELGRDPDEDV